MFNFFVVRIVSVSSENIDYYLNKIQTDSNFKAAYGDSLTKILYFDQITGESRYKICKDVILTLPVVIYTLKNFYMLDEINQNIETLKSAGLIEFWYFQFVKKQNRSKKTQKMPSILKLAHFEGCLGILIAGFTVSCVVFVVEILVKFKHEPFKLTKK